jgi:hypothetical protein
MTLPPDPQPSTFVVMIGPKEIYDAVIGLTATVERVANQQSDTRNDVADHETRIRGLERGRWPLPTIAALAGVGALIVAILALIYRSHS